MVTRAYIMRAALAVDSVMSRAFLRALGLFVPYRHGAGTVAPVEHEQYDGDVLWCFANHGSPMDGRGDGRP